MYDLEWIRQSSLGMTLERLSLDFFWEFAGFLRPPVKNQSVFLPLLRNFLVRNFHTDNGCKSFIRQFGDEEDLRALSSFPFRLEEAGEDAKALWRWITLYSDSRSKGLDKAFNGIESIFFEWTRTQRHIGAYLAPDRLDPLIIAYRQNVSIPLKLLDFQSEKRSEEWLEREQRSPWDEFFFQDGFGEIGVGPGDGLYINFEQMLLRRFLLLHLGDLTSDEHESLLKEFRLTDKLKNSGLYQDRLMALPDLVDLYPQEMKDAILIDKWTFGRKP